MVALYGVRHQLWTLWGFVRIQWTLTLKNGETIGFWFLMFVPFLGFL